MSKIKNPWPTKAVMQQIYDKHLWGGKDVDFYSGAGSHASNMVQPYLDTVITFLKSHHNSLTVCDLGCGDFNIGKHLIKYTKNYSAIDIVENLIDRNKRLFKAANLEFHCMDIVEDELPECDCILLRQVLQHLSNTEIQVVVEKLFRYKYVILTEHIPMGNFIPNIDIISGQGIRLKQHSGVDLSVAPFNLVSIEEQKLCEIILEDTKGRILTTLYKIIT